MSAGLPGLNPQRLVQLMATAVERCHLDLRGAVVLTEARTGAYIVTPILAAMAGASHVLAVTRSTRYGSVEQVCEQTLHLAELAGVNGGIEVVSAKTATLVAQADIITNSGHVRPLDAIMIGWMKPTAVIPLMYEAWELRPDDLDVDACHRRGILVAGTNERHPAVDVFSYLGVMAIKLLLEAGVSVYSTRLLLLCDNAFAGYIERGLIGAGAKVDVCADLAAAITSGQPAYDAIVVALQPKPEPVLMAADINAIAKRWPGAVIAQYWGDVDRAAAEAAGVPIWPPEAPGPGHMAILPSAVGPESIVRLQSGGLKVGEVLWRAANASGAEHPVQSEWIDQYV